MPTCTTTTCPAVCGSIAGHVTDLLSTAAIQGANVSASGPGSGSDTTDELGYYEIGGLTPGTYSVTASATGYQDETHTGITVNAGWTTTVDFALTPLPPTSVSIRALEDPCRITFGSDGINTSTLRIYYCGADVTSSAEIVNEREVNLPWGSLSGGHLNSIRVEATDFLGRPVVGALSPLDFRPELQSKGV